MRLGVAYPGGPEDQRAWSGIPAGLVRGLREAGAEVFPLDPAPGGAIERAARVLLAPLYPTDLPRHPGRSLLLAAMGPEVARLRSRALAHRLRTAPALDALMIINSLCVPPAGEAVVTYEDMTVPLAVRHGYPLWQALPRRAVRARMRVQGELYQRATVCCLATHFAGESVERDYGVDPAKIEVVGVGRNHEPVLRERDWTRPRFLFVGRDWERKRGAAVVAAFARVRERIPEARLDLVGNHPPTIAPGVTGHGPVSGPALATHFALATCFVMPSFVEPAGIVYAEAAAAGTPSIGTSIGGAAEMIGPGGVVVDPGDPPALHRAMLELSDPDVARRLGAAARRHSEWFTWRATGERVLGALSREEREL
jgi:glycogen synthase